MQPGFRFQSLKRSSAAIVEALERGAADNLTAWAVTKMRATLESAGVAFIPEVGGGAGVRFPTAASRKVGSEAVTDHSECGCRATASGPSRRSAGGSDECVLRADTLRSLWLEERAQCA